MASSVGRFQDHIKKSSTDLVLWILRLASGAVLALTFALIAQQLLSAKPGENLLSFVFVFVAISWTFMRISKGWNLTRLVVFDLICALVGLLLRMYIVVAPNL